MRLGFYLKFAIDGIKKNKKLYIPYVLTCSIMFAMCYIIYFLKDSKAVAKVSFLINTGVFSWIFAFFSGLVLFYTNSFLIKRRKKEFGLYNVLGMNKRNISKILFFETLITLVIVIILGLICGFLLYKLAETLLLSMLGGDIDYNLVISSDASIWTSTVFCVVFALIFLNSLRQISFSNAISLIKSENFGEKSPKSNMFVGIIGLLLLTGAYIATLNVSGYAATWWFFIGAILVIVSTYIIMISSSVFMCRVLKNNKHYYYKSNHFISISSMMYRMKRNGAGLASICVLLTIVQFIMSTCIFVQWVTDDMLKCQYPQQNTQVRVTEENIDRLLSDDKLKIRKEILSFASDNDVKLKNYFEYRNIGSDGRALSIYGDKIDMSCDWDYSRDNGPAKHIDFEIIPIEDYNKNMGTNETLNYGEAIVNVLGGEYDKDSISFTWAGKQEKTFKIVDKQLEPMKIDRSWYTPKFVIFISNISEAKEIENMILSCNGDSQESISPGIQLRFDVDCSNDQIKDFIDNLRKKTYEIYDNLKLKGIRTDNYYQSKNIDFNTIKELLFISIFFIILFTLVVILIMYYKQVSEGYEDANRFDIMKKVGISKREIKKSVNSQLLITFFAPLILTGLHTVFSIIMLCKMIFTTAYHDYSSFICMAFISFVLLSLLYCVMYKVTSRVYYKIVGGVDKD